MIETRFTSFHIDFSTLDIERGQVSLMPSSFAIVMQPQIRSGGVVLRVEDMEPERPRENMLPGATSPASKKRTKSRMR